MTYKLEAIDREGEFRRIELEECSFSFSRDMRREDALELAKRLIEVSFSDRDYRNSEVSEWLDETFPFLESYFVDGNTGKLSDDYAEFTEEELGDE